MKRIRKTISVTGLVAIVVSFLFLVGCDKPGPTPAVSESDRVTGLMTSGIWKVNSVTIDGVADNSFAAMTLSFTKTAYTTTKGGVVWPAAGTWSFTDATAKKIKRDDGIEVAIDAISSTAMTLSLTWNKTTLGGGRLNSVQGKHVFIFKK